MKQLLAMKTEMTGQGRPLVLVPGGLTGWLSWKPHAERLSKDHKVVRVQLLTVNMGLRRERLPEFPYADVHDLAGGHALHIVRMEEFFGVFLPFLS